jgi:hypothetical protein
MDITTIVVLVIIGLLLLYLFRRNQSAANTGSGSQMGSERPRYDDRNIQGQGSFGSDNSDDRNYMPADRRAEDLRDAIDPSIRRNQSDAQSASNDDRDRTGAGAVTRPSTRTSPDRDEPRRTDDSPNVQGQGSFGRDKS